MEAFKIHGGYVSFRDSGDVAMPRRAVLIRSNQKTEWMDGQTDEDAWYKLARQLSVEAMEPEQLDGI